LASAAFFWQREVVLQMRTSALYGAKRLRFFFEIYRIVCTGREVSQCGQEGEVIFSRFCTDVFYGRAPKQKSPDKVCPWKKKTAQITKFHPLVRKTSALRQPPLPCTCRHSIFLKSLNFFGTNTIWRISLFHNGSLFYGVYKRVSWKCIQLYVYKQTESDFWVKN